MPRYILRDRDSIYGEIFKRRLRAMGIRDRPTAPRSPWQNGHTERLIGSIRRECLDHVVVFGERHLRHLLLSYMAFRNGSTVSSPSHRLLPSAAFSTGTAFHDGFCQRRRSLASVRGQRLGRHTMPSEETVSLSNDAWSDKCLPLPYNRLHWLHRPGDGTLGGAVTSFRPKISFPSINSPREPSWRAPLSSNGNPSRRPTSDARSRRA